MSFENAITSTSIKGLFQGLSPEGSAVIQGTVISINPVKIQVTGDDKLVLSGDSLIIPRHLTDYNIDMTVSHFTETEAAHLHEYSGRKTFLVHGALKTSENVYLLSFNNKKKYYILDRMI